MNRAGAARAAWMGGVVVALGVGLVAGRATFVPPQVQGSELPVATHTVAEASVGASVSLPVTARWETRPLAAGSMSGMVTSVAFDGVQEVGAGDIVLTVDLRPVVAAQGSVPAFRDLATGARGTDVRQLQEFLREAGHLRSEPNGVFGAATTRAVDAWQRSLGVERTGVVRAGDLVFIESLPARIVLSDDVVVGALVTPGQAVLSALPEAPGFTITMGGTVQAATIPHTGASITIEAPNGGTWDAIVTGSVPNDVGGTVLSLAGSDGGPVCADECALIEYTGHDHVLPGRSIVADDVTGPALPVAAVGTAPDGTRFAVRTDGTRVPVTVLAADASRVIVDGVGVGDVVRLFATVDDAPDDHATHADATS